jgi:replicative DNA helicase
MNPQELAQKVQKISQVLPILETELLSRGDSPKLSLSSLPDFNRKIWGLKKGLTVIGGRTSQGKTSLAMQFAYDLASQGNEVLFLSLEETVEQILERLFCNECSVDNYSLMTGKFNFYKADWDSFVAKVSNIPLLITCGIGYDFNDITQLIGLMKFKPKAIFVDYLQAIKQGQKEREMLNEYLRSFKAMCMENDIAGVMGSQINRQINEVTKEPSLDCLKGTGTIEETADMVLLVHWENFYTHKEDNENKFKIIVAKNKRGKTGDHEVHFEPKYYKFSEIDKTPERSIYEKDI